MSYRDETDCRNQYYLHKKVTFYKKTTDAGYCFNGRIRVVFRCLGESVINDFRNYACI